MDPAMLETMRNLMRTPQMSELQYNREASIMMHMESKNMRETDKEFVRTFGSMPYHPEESMNAHLPEVEIIPENCITIKDIIKKGPNNVHDGKFLLCRSICPVWGISHSNHAIIDDPDGQKTLSLLLYNLKFSVPIGSIIALMNPWLKSSITGSTSLRVDNTAEQVVILERTHPILKDVTWKAKLPFPSEVRECDQFRIAGGRYFNKGNYEKALECYTETIKEDSGNPVHYANRSLTCLMLGKPESALEDAENGLNLDPDHFKLCFRKAKALIDLKRYEDGISFLKGTSFLANPEVGELVKMAENGLKDVQKMPPSSPIKHAG